MKILKNNYENFNNEQFKKLNINDKCNIKRIQYKVMMVDQSTVLNSQTDYHQEQKAKKKKNRNLENYFQHKYKMYYYISTW